MTNDRLISFLYVIIRDHLTVGTLEKVLRQVDKADGLDTQYTLRTAEIFAVDMAARIEKRAERATRDEPLEIAIGDRFEWTGLDYPSVNNGDVIRVTGGEGPKWNVYNETQKRSKDSWQIESPRWRRFPPVAIGDRFEWLAGYRPPLKSGDVVRVIGTDGNHWRVYNETKKCNVPGTFGMDPSCWRRLPSAPRSPAAEGMLVTDFGSLCVGDTIRKSDGTVAVLARFNQRAPKEESWWTTVVVKGDIGANTVESWEVDEELIYLISGVTP